MGSGTVGSSHALRRRATQVVPTIVTHTAAPRLLEMGGGATARQTAGKGTGATIPAVWLHRHLHALGLAVIYRWHWMRSSTGSSARRPTTAPTLAGKL